jgi:hypothetical protein
MQYITPFYAAIAGLIYLLLSVRTLLLRKKLQVGVGDGGDETLLRAMRVHGNFSEYAPFTLLLIFMLELNGGAPQAIHGLCVLLLTGRVFHAWGVRKVDENLAFRVAGMALTFTSLLFATLGILYLAISAG